MRNESQGQISVEIVLLIGLMLVIVLGIVQYIGPVIEQDKVMSAAKSGSIEASNTIAYTGTGNVIRFNNMTFNDGVITINLYSKKALSTEDKIIIKNNILKDIAQSLNTNISGNTVKGRYTYSVVINNTV